MGERRIGGLVLALAAAANAVVVVVLWLRAGGVTEPGGAAEWLVSLGRVAGLLGAYLVLVELLLLARIPVLDRLVGFDRRPSGTGATGTRCSRSCRARGADHRRLHDRRRNLAARRGRRG